MTKQELVKELKDTFIARFGKDVEVGLKHPICCIKDWQCGNGYIESVRYNGGGFEYYLNYWSYGWKSDKSTFDKYAIQILSQCLGKKVKTKTEYFLE